MSEPGDIADISGSIWLHGIHGKGTKLKCGVILLTAGQAEAAALYGWRKCPRHDAEGLLAVERDAATADEMWRKALYEGLRS